jgi:RNA polymerase sigma-70 factor (ECF subfamily)
MHRIPIGPTGAAIENPRINPETNPIPTNAPPHVPPAPPPWLGCRAGSILLIVDSEKTATDDQLLLRVGEGDLEAFFDLYDRHAGRVLALCRHVLGEAMAAEDATQETFLRIWTRARLFNPSRGKPTTWMLTIARRIAIDRLRLEARRLAPDDLDADETWHEVPDPGSTEEDARWQSLRLAVADLPPEQRRVVRLAFFFGLSHSQIAAALGTPLGTVKTRMRLGMRKLRDMWGAGGREASDHRRPGVPKPGMTRKR